MEVAIVFVLDSAIPVSTILLAKDREDAEDWVGQFPQIGSVVVLAPSEVEESDELRVGEVFATFDAQRDPAFDRAASVLREAKERLGLVTVMPTPVVG